MNPTLLLWALFGGGALLAVSGAGASSPSSAGAPSSAPGPGGGGGGSGELGRSASAAAASGDLERANILHAVSVALRTESDGSQLEAFGSALQAMGGYGAAAGELLAAAARKGASGSQAAPGTATPSNPLGTVAVGPPDASGAPTPVAVNFIPEGSVALSSGYVVDPSSGAVTGRIDGSGNFVPKGGGQAQGKGGQPVSGTSEFGPSGLSLSPNDLPYWVNLYAKTRYTEGQNPSKADVDKAVKNAIAHYASHEGTANISTFWSVLNAYGYTSEAEELHALTVVPFYVQAYSGEKTWSEAALLKAFKNASKGAPINPGQTDLNVDIIPNQIAFANALWGYKAFGNDWSSLGMGLFNEVVAELMNEGQTAEATSLMARKPGQW